MKIPKKVVETVDAKIVRFHAKIRDEGSYTLLDAESKAIAELDGYVPSFFPYGKDGLESHFGDYIDLWIDLETGQIMNWIKPTPEQVAKDFAMIESEE